MTVRIGSGIDVHPFAPDPRPLLLAGVEVSGTAGLDGHSDADVVAHAITDALLGALALGDLGSFFGVDTPDLRGADSMVLLARAVAVVADHGFAVGNLDCTVIAQQPRLGRHLPAMRTAVAATVGVAESAVSIKATTTDRLGSIGRVEGIACWATVLVAAT